MTQREYDELNKEVSMLAKAVGTLNPTDPQFIKSVNRLEEIKAVLADSTKMRKPKLRLVTVRKG